MNKKGYQKLVIRTQKQKKISKKYFLAAATAAARIIYLSVIFPRRNSQKRKRRKGSEKVFKTFSFSSFSLLTEGLQEEEDLDPISYH